MTPEEKRTTLAKLREAIGQNRPEKTPRKGFTTAPRRQVAEASDWARRARGTAPAVPRPIRHHHPPAPGRPHPTGPAGHG